MNAIRRLAPPISLAWLATPAALAAHQGPAGGHGWLEGALQPTLGIDHFLAGGVVAVWLSIGLVAVLRRAGSRRLRR